SWSRLSRTGRHVEFSSSPSLVQTVLDQNPSHLLDRFWRPLLVRVERENLANLPNYVAELRVRESGEWVRLVTALVSLDDEVEIFSRGAGFVESEIVGTDEHDRVAGLGCEAVEPVDSIAEHGLCDRHVLQNDSKFAG